MYSLVSAPVLGFDLTRLEGGSATAEVLLRAFTLTADDLPILAGHLLDEAQRVELWLEVESAAGKLPSARELADYADASAVLGLVERAPIGSLDALLRCLRHDVMAWTWTGTGAAARQSETAAAATALLCDAAVGSYLRDLLSAATRRRLGGGWVAATRRLPAGPPIDLGPHHYALSALLDRLRTLRPEDVRRLSRAADDARRGQPTGWATAVHSASWAAYLSDRVRTAAAAQLLLVQALDNGLVPVAERAGGVWNLLSGAVQALVVRDLLDTATAHRLMAPVIAVLGPTWLT
ncbi:MAG TPA: hypothetical protein VNV66_16165 [Pilimelia sp.]|nr:hypothetical protein [Pilimelia sp.]